MAAYWLVVISIKSYANNLVALLYPINIVQFVFVENNKHSTNQVYYTERVTGRYTRHFPNTTNGWIKNACKRRRSWLLKCNKRNDKQSNF